MHRPLPARLFRGILVTLGGAVLALGGCGEPEQAAPPPLEIPVVEILQQDVPIYVEVVGQTRGSLDIPIRARVDGVLESMDFQEGLRVTRGQLLYTIDPQPFEAEVAAAKSRVAEAQTLLAKAKSDRERIEPLAAMDAVSQQDLDGAVAQHEAAIAGLQAAKAMLELAKIELGYTRIHSPIDGRIGLSAAKVGEYVGREPNPVVLNFVSQTDPIRVRYSINEREYLEYRRRFMARRDNLDGSREVPEREPNLELILADGSVHEHLGITVTSDAAVDPNTGTLTLEADFPNPNGLVLAGQFARIRGRVETRENALLVPQRAVMEMQGNFQVAVVGADNTVEIRQVKLGPQHGRYWLVDEGLAAGERVALEGLLRMQPGIKVAPTLVDFEAGPGAADSSGDEA